MRFFITIFISAVLSIITNWVILILFDNAISLNFVFSTIALTYINFYFFIFFLPDFIQIIALDEFVRSIKGFSVFVFSFAIFMIINFTPSKTIINSRYNVSDDKGVISINSIPSNATVWINGKNQYNVRTPFTINVKAGIHNIMLQKDGYVKFSTALEVSSGETISLNVPLKLLESKIVNIDSINLSSTKIAIDEIIENLRNANLTFIAPETMIVGEKRSIMLLMSMEIPTDSLKTELIAKISDTTKIGEIFEASLKATEKMEALLSGFGFTIKPITKIAQLVRGKNSTGWEWVIKADEAGSQILYLTINAFIDYNGEQVTQTIQTFRQKIFIYVKPTTAIVEWFNKNMSLIAGLITSIITLLFGYYLAILRERRKREKEKKPKIIKP